MQTKSKTHSSKSSKRILSVTIRRVLDDSPDTSYLGEYANSPTSEFSIDRAHAEDCVSQNPISEEGRAKLERIAEYINSLRVDSELDTPADQDLAEAIATVIDRAEPTEHCDCNGGDMERGQYRYFNPSFNYVDKHGKLADGNTAEEVRKYVRQDYDRMESLNRGDWCYIGIRVDAEVQLTAAWENSVVSKVSWHSPIAPYQTITSGGLYGIESDSGNDYLQSIEQEELSELRAQLKELGFSTRAISTAFKTVEHKEE